MRNELPSYAMLPPGYQPVSEWLDPWLEGGIVPGTTQCESHAEALKASLVELKAMKTSVAELKQSVEKLQTRKSSAGKRQALEGSPEEDQALESSTEAEELMTSGEELTTSGGELTTSGEEWTTSVGGASVDHLDGLEANETGISPTQNPRSLHWLPTWSDGEVLQSIHGGYSTSHTLIKICN
jgi:hypothetical protein